MKKIISFLLVATIIVILIGCSHDVSNIDTHAETQTETQQLSTSGTEESASSALACYVIPTFFTYEEYEAYLDRFVELSSDFIHYETFEQCGEFSSFRDLTNLDEYGFINNDGVWLTVGDCNTYRYDVIDPTGTTIYIHISPATNYTDRFTSAKDIGASQNLLQVKYESGDYRYQDILYGFKNGKLVQMLVPCEQSMLSIRRPDFEPFEPSLSENDSFISGLLNTETAGIALAELNAKVAAARAEKAD